MSQEVTIKMFDFVKSNVHLIFRLVCTYYQYWFYDQKFAATVYEHFLNTLEVIGNIYF